MAATTSNRNVQRKTESRNEAVESPEKISRDILDFVTNYAREKPGYAALWCIGIGFVLGWKLKPWFAWAGSKHRSSVLAGGQPARRRGEPGQS
jgi:hypothetical protein